MQAFEALMKEHESIKDLLENLIALEESDYQSRSFVVKSIRENLTPYPRGEESFF